MTETAKHPFWDFSLALYGREGVARACVALQDRRGLDVNILLFCCWAGSRGRRLDPADLKGLDAAVRPWREAVVRPCAGSAAGSRPRPRPRVLRPIGCG